MANFNMHMLGRPEEQHTDGEISALLETNNAIFSEYVGDALAEGAEPLDLSILKWELVREGLLNEESCCALCDMHEDCETCPIGIEHGDCTQTPYHDYWMMKVSESIDDDSYRSTAFPSKRLLEIIDEELEMLKELRVTENRRERESHWKIRCPTCDGILENRKLYHQVQRCKCGLMGLDWITGTDSWRILGEYRKVRE